MELRFKVTCISRLKHMVLFFILLIIRLSLTDALDCYQCSNVRNISDCHNFAICTDNEFCFTDTLGYGDQTRFNMGCRDQSVCTAQATTTTTISPMSIIGREATQDLECSQCCGVDACNKHLCTTGTHAITQDGDCHDDPDFNCAQVSAVFNVCGDREHAKHVCRKFCGFCASVDGGWSSWSDWTNCDTSCGNGTLSRSRVCDNPKPEHGGLRCIGSDNDRKSCFLKPCPVDGGWSTWSSWDTCSISCGIGMQTRSRGCSHPSPSLGGLQCPGDAIDTKTCFLQSCSDGVWSSWSSWSTCSQSCLGGLSTRQRQCNSPIPSTFGHDCVGNNEESKICNSIPCQGHPVNGGWTSWSSWSTCPVSCGGGLKARTRSCTNPTPSNFGRSCIGNSVDKTICNTNVCPVHTVNGQWSYWSSWSSCSVTCDGGVKQRTRSCSRPSPSQNGRACVGNSIDVSVCNIFNCPGASLARLVGPTNFEGRLEVFYNGGWGTVCDDSFSDIDAQVVCRMMNLPWTGAIALPRAFYGQGSLPIKLDDVGCVTSDTNLFQCRLDVGTSDCSHSEDVGVACYPPLQVRLRDGSSSHNGRVEVSFDGKKWGTVCDDGFSVNSAKVVCRMLGFTTYNARSTNTYGAGSGDILLDDVSCSGSESTLLKCKHRKLSTNNCGHGEDVGVICG